MITLSNILTQEERLQIPRLIGHDNIRIWELLSRRASISEIRQMPIDYDAADAMITHLVDTEKLVRDLILFKKVALRGIEIGGILNELKRLFCSIEKSSKLGVDNIQGVDKIASNEYVLHSVLYNLIRNGMQAQQDKPEDKRKVDLIVDSSGFPAQAIYIPEGAGDYQEFVRFSVQNPGEFPRDKPLIERLTICPPQGKHGVGLYFTGLAAKVLRAPVNIKSEAGLVDVSFYQPVYPQEAGEKNDN